MFLSVRAGIEPGAVEAAAEGVDGAGETERGTGVGVEVREEGAGGDFS